MFVAGSERMFRSKSMSAAPVQDAKNATQRLILIEFMNFCAAAGRIVLTHHFSSDKHPSAALPASIVQTNLFDMVM
jgi:hypothetical protein